MSLLGKGEYRKLLAPPMTEVSLDAAAEAAALGHARSVWRDVGLEPRALAPADIACAYQPGGSELRLVHVRAFARERRDTFLIVALRGAAPVGHIVLDLAAEHAMPVFECPSARFRGPATRAAIRDLIPRIAPTDAEPCAVLATGDGTYLQTLRTADGWVLEHQLVNTSSHYEAPGAVDTATVVDAFLSYAFGKDEWATGVAWRRAL